MLWESTVFLPLDSLTSYSLVFFLPFFFFPISDSSTHYSKITVSKGPIHFLFFLIVHLLFLVHKSPLLALNNQSTNDSKIYAYILRSCSQPPYLYIFKQLLDIPTWLYYTCLNQNICCKLKSIALKNLTLQYLNCLT